MDIRLGEVVESLEFQGRKIVAAKTAQGRYECDRMVVNADFAHAMTRLVPDKIRSNWNNRKIESRRYSCSTFMLYLGVEGSFPDIEHHTIYMAKDYESNLKDIESRHVLSEDPSFYVHNPSRIDPSMAPRGHSSLYLLVPVSHQHANIDWKAEAPRFRQLALDRLRLLGLGDIEDGRRGRAVEIDPLIHLVGQDPGAGPPAGRQHQLQRAALGPDHHVGAHQVPAQLRLPLVTRLHQAGQQGQAHGQQDHVHHRQAGTERPLPPGPGQAHAQPRAMSSRAGRARRLDGDGRLVGALHIHDLTRAKVI